jgi:hypothetical protein
VKIKLRGMTVTGNSGFSLNLPSLLENFLEDDAGHFYVV